MICIVSNCGRPRWGRDLCKLHYDRWWRGADLPASPSRNAVQPRYCTCTGKTPKPLPWGECPDCRRLVESHASA